MRVCPVVIRQLPSRETSIGDPAKEGDTAMVSLLAVSVKRAKSRFALKVVV